MEFKAASLKVSLGSYSLKERSLIPTVLVSLWSLNDLNKSSVYVGIRGHQIKLIKQSLKHGQNINHKLSINGAISFFVQPYFERAIFVSLLSRFFD